MITTPLSSEDYARMHRASDIYVSPSRGEGWGMPVAEAMSMGRPAIVTNWSGLADFVDEVVGYPVNYSLTRVRELVAETRRFN